MELLARAELVSPGASALYRIGDVVRIAGRPGVIVGTFSGAFRRGVAFAARDTPDFPPLGPDVGEFHALPRTATLARLRPGVHIAQAAAEMEALQRAWERSEQQRRGATIGASALRLVPLRDHIARDRAGVLSVVSIAGTVLFLMSLIAGSVLQLAQLALHRHDVRSVSPGYFETVGLTPLAGRLIEDRDAADSESVVVVGEGTARALWPDRSATEKRCS